MELVDCLISKKRFYYYYFYSLISTWFANKAQQGSSSSKASKEKTNKADTAEENSEDYVYPPTPFGEKKVLSPKMIQSFDSDEVEKSLVLWHSFSFSLN